MKSEIIDLGSYRMNVVEQGSGPLLLLVHGFPLDHSMWAGQLDALSDSCRVLAPDLRGFGKSDAVDGTLLMSDLADDLVTLLDALGNSTPVAIAGLSMGGYVAFEFWRRHAPRLSHLILCDTRAAADSPEAAQNRRDSAERALLEGTEFLANAMLPKLFTSSTRTERPDVVEALGDVILDTSPRTVAAVQRGMAQRHDMTNLLPQIQIPVLAVCGEDDVISPPAEMKAIADRIPKARYLEVERAGHLAPLEQPAAVNQAIRDFLRDTE